MYHDISEVDPNREKKSSSTIEIDPIDENQLFDPRYFRPLMVSLRVALHQITVHLIHVNSIENLQYQFLIIMLFSTPKVMRVQLVSVKDYV